MDVFLCYHQHNKAIHRNVLHAVYMLAMVFICKVTTVIAAQHIKNKNKFTLSESLKHIKGKQTVAFIFSVNI